jgi:CRISPR-associated endonuclease Csy4
MDAYLEWQVRPDPEVLPPEVLSQAIQRLHGHLSRSGERRVGVSFPEHASSSFRRSLGTRLRVHGPMVALELLADGKWLGPVLDHLTGGVLRPVPSAVLGHRVVSRVQAKSNVDRLRRRQMKRKGWTREEAEEAIPDQVRETLALPYVVLRSGSTGQSFPLFIRHGPVQPWAVKGTFSAYGLSAVTTVPWF